MNEDGDPGAWFQNEERTRVQHRRRGLTACKLLSEETTAGDMDTPDLDGSTAIDGEQTQILVTKGEDYEGGYLRQR